MAHVVAPSVFVAATIFRLPRYGRRKDMWGHHMFRFGHLVSMMRASAGRPFNKFID